MVIIKHACASHQQMHNAAEGVPGRGAGRRVWDHGTLVPHHRPAANQDHAVPAQEHLRQPPRAPLLAPASALRLLKLWWRACACSARMHGADKVLGWPHSRN